MLFFIKISCSHLYLLPCVKILFKIIFQLYYCFTGFYRKTSIHTYTYMYSCTCNIHNFILHSHVCAQLPQSCLILFDPFNHSQPSSFVHEVLPIRILEWVAISSSRGSSPPRDWTHISCIFCIAGGLYTAESPGKPK